MYFRFLINSLSYKVDKTNGIYTEIVKPIILAIIFGTRKLFPCESNILVAISAAITTMVKKIVIIYDLVSKADRVIFFEIKYNKKSNIRMLIVPLVIYEIKISVTRIHPSCATHIT